MSDLKIVVLDPSTRYLLDNLGPDVFDNPVDPAQLEAFLNDPSHLMVLGVQAGRVVGFASGVMNYHPDKSPVLFLSEIGTVPAERRKGIASALAKALIDLGKARGCTGCWLATEIDNDAARGLYRALGARETRDIVVYDWDVAI